MFSMGDNTQAYLGNFRHSPGSLLIRRSCMPAEESVPAMKGPLSRNGGQRSHLGRNLDFADLYGRRHPMSRACRQATSDCFADIVEGLGFRSSLGDAAGNRRALDYEHAGFIRLQRHKELHTWILSRLWS